MNTIVLGHSGFIGQHTLACYGKLSLVERCGDLVLPDLDLQIREQAQQLGAFLTPESTILMCAGIKRQWGDTLEIFRQNMAIVENLSAVLEKKRPKKLMFLSSAAVYGEDVHNTNINEESEIRLGTYYAISKFASECLLRKVLAVFPETSLVILRPPLVYGKGDTSKGYGPAGFIDKILNDQEIILWGDGSELREFLYAPDLARLICDLIVSDFRGVVNPVSGKSSSFQDVIRILSAITGKNPKVTSRERSKDKVDSVFSGSLLRQILPAFRFTSLEEGLREMLEARMED